MSETDPQTSGDHIEVGKIKNGKAIAIGRGATAVYQGLTYDEVVALLAELKNQDQPTVWNGRIPYLGLSAYQEADARYFFGRESLVEELLQRVQTANFITIAGPSGSGKSSVARAGLFHALREGTKIENSDRWLLSTMQPKGNPIEQLAQAIERLTKTPGTGDHLRQNSPENPLALHQQAETLLSEDPSQRFVLLVDQFEELFTQTKDATVRQTFINLLTEAAQAADSRVRILISLRSDFVSNCASHEKLRELISQQFQLVGAMAPRDLAKAITLPALEVGAEIDPKLVSQIIADMKGSPDALPLMSFALRDLFEVEKTKQGEPMDLTLPEYVKRGGLEEALERHANKVFSHFTAEQKEIAKNIFSKLIEVGQGRVDTRRTATFAELLPAGSSATAVTTVLSDLADVRLVTTSDLAVVDGQPVTTSSQEATVTIAHEKIIDAWPWLRKLVDENRDLIALQNQINNDAHLYAQKNDNGYLYRGGRLLNVEEKLDVLQPNLSAQSMRFITTSINLRQQERAEKELRREKELEDAKKLAKAAEAQRAAEVERATAEALRAKEAEESSKKQSRLTRIAFGIGFIAIVAAIIAGFFGVSASNSEATAVAEATRSSMAEAEATRALATAVSSEIIALTKESEALQAQATAEFARSETAVQANLAKSYLIANEALDYTGSDNILPFLLAIQSAKYSNTPIAYRALSQWFPDIGIKLHNSSINSIQWNLEENRLLTSSDDGKAMVWDILENQIAIQMEHEVEVKDARWNKDRQEILTTANDNKVRIWNSQNGTFKYDLTLNSSAKIADWNHDNTQILTVSTQGEVKIWDAETGEIIYDLNHLSPVNTAQWNPESQTILTTENNGNVNIWNVESASLPHQFKTQRPIMLAKWSNDGRNFLTVDSAGEVRIWVFKDNQWQFNAIFFAEPVSDALWSQTDNMFLIYGGGGQSGFAKAYSVEDLQGIFVANTENLVFNTLWSSDEKHLMLFMENGGIEYWDVENRKLLISFAFKSLSITSAQWDELNNEVIIGTNDGSVYKYFLEMTELVDLACSVTSRNLGLDEWSRYFPDESYSAICENVDTPAQIPLIQIAEVECKLSVTIETLDFPVDQIFTIRMGKFGTRGIGGVVVGSADSGSGGSFRIKLIIPEVFAEDEQVAIRLDSETGWYSFNWFYNNVPELGCG